MDLGVYCVYPALYLFGKPQNTLAVSHLLASGADGSDIVAMQYPDKLVNLVFSKVGQAGAKHGFSGHKRHCIRGVHLKTCQHLYPL